MGNVGGNKREGKAGKKVSYFVGKKVTTTHAPNKPYKRTFNEKSLLLYERVSVLCRLDIERQTRFVCVQYYERIISQLLGFFSNSYCFRGEECNVTCVKVLDRTWNKRAFSTEMALRPLKIGPSVRMVPSMRSWVFLSGCFNLTYFYCNFS